MKISKHQSESILISTTTTGPQQDSRNEMAYQGHGGANRGSGPVSGGAEMPG